MPSSGIEFALTMRYKQSPSAPLRSRRHRAILHLRAVEAGTSRATGDGNEALTNGTSQIHRRQSLPPPPKSGASADGDSAEDEGARPSASPSAALLSKADMCVLATQEFKPGDIIYACKGGITDLSREEDEALREEAAHHRSLKHQVPSESETEAPTKKFRYRGALGAGRDFSVIRSARKGCSQLFLGPARFVNHDCEPNVEFYRMGNQMAFRCIRAIHVNEEIVTYYGDNYFEVDNAECLCVTCEARQQGAFTPAGDESPSAAGPSRAASIPSMPDDGHEQEELSIAERALRRHAAEKPVPPSALSEHLNLQEVKYTESNSDTKDGNITRKMLDEPEALLEPAGGGNRGPERECYTCGIHFWSKESWWTQEECARCERHYKLFKADWPSRVPVEGDGKKALTGPEIVLTPPQEGHWYYYEDRKELPPLSWRKRKALQSASDGTPDSSDAGTPVVLTPLRDAGNADYFDDPAVKRRRMSLRSHSSLRSTSEGSSTSSPRRKSAYASSQRRKSNVTHRPVQAVRTSRRRPQASGRTTSSHTDSRPRRASSESLGTPRSVLSELGDDLLSIEVESPRRTRRSSARALPSQKKTSPTRDPGLTMLNLPPAPLPEDPPDHDSFLSAPAPEALIGVSAPPFLPKKKEQRPSFLQAVDASPAPPSTAFEPRGARILGKQATTDALAMHWGASSEGRFRPRTSQNPQPPQALHPSALEHKSNGLGDHQYSPHNSKTVAARGKRQNSTPAHRVSKRQRHSLDSDALLSSNGDWELHLDAREHTEGISAGSAQSAGDVLTAGEERVEGTTTGEGTPEGEGLPIATQGSERTSVQNLALAWTAGIGSKRARKPVAADPVLLAAKQPAAGRQSRTSAPGSAPSSAASSTRSRSQDIQTPRRRTTRRSSGRGQRSPSPVQSPSIPRDWNSTRMTSPLVKAELASPSLAPSLSASVVSPSLNPVPGPSSPAGTSPAGSIGSDSSQPAPRPSGRRNLRWGKGKASFSRPLKALKQLACPPEVAASARAMVARKQPESHASLQRHQAESSQKPRPSPPPSTPLPASPQLRAATAYLADTVPAKDAANSTATAARTSPHETSTSYGQALFDLPTSAPPYPAFADQQH